MINYNENNIFSEKVYKCLAFDPFNSIQLKENKLFTNLEKKQFYKCSFDCFDIYENIPTWTYHYEISCLCLEKCYDNLKVLKIKFN
jgi:hypothetical protein